jgi:hypothetical protein
MAKDKEGHGSEGYLGSKEHSGRWNVAEGKDRGVKTLNGQPLTKKEARFVSEHTVGHEGLKSSERKRT